jgi:hypothetical protein
MNEPARCVYCGFDVPDLSAHLGDGDVCCKAQYIGERELQKVTETSRYRLLFYETSPRGDLYELEQYRYFILVDRRTDERVMHFQGSYATSLSRTGGGWESAPWIGVWRVEFAPDERGLLVFDDDCDVPRRVPFASRLGAPPDAFPDWSMALRTAIAQFGPLGWSGAGWRPGREGAPLVEPAPGHTTHVWRALPQQFHLACVDIDWTACTIRFADFDQHDASDNVLRVTRLPEDWVQSLRSVHWP